VSIDTVEIEPEEIDGDFVPHARSDVAAVHVEREIVIGRVPEGSSYLQTCALNESGSIVWQCFDGSGTIDEIATDIADVFGADSESVTADVLALAREVGGLGFLVGVKEQVLEVDDERPGLAVGSRFPDFEAADQAGNRVSGEQLAGRRALLVSWSSTCSFCKLIARDLADLSPTLAERGVDIVLLSSGAAPPPFEGLGTPVAYLVDERGLVAEPLALGSTEVMQLARGIAQVE
jgi:hypothetical protein